MAELVIADQAVVQYPGGLVAVRCQDFMAAARGTLTSDTDALSCSGTRVEDTQTVTTSILDDQLAAYEEALDTLELPYEDLGLLDEEYSVWASFRIPGDWDLTNEDTMRGSGPWACNFVVDIGCHGDSYQPTESDFQGSSESFNRSFSWKTPHYLYLRVGLIFLEAGQTLIIRAYAQDGTTASWELDQLVFVPHPGFTGQNHQYVGGQEGNLGVPDGADGGDDNGKFTAAPDFARSNNPNDPLEMSPGAITGAGQPAGGGDYQRKDDAASAEWYSQVADIAALTLQDEDGNERAAHAYSVHCVRWKPERVVVNEDFDRTVAAGWGKTPEGYGWNGGATISANISVTGGIASFTGDGDKIIGLRPGYVDNIITTPDHGGRLQMTDAWVMSGETRMEDVVPEGGTDSYFLQVSTFDSFGFGDGNNRERNLAIRFWHSTIVSLDKVWEFRWGDLTFPNTILHSGSIASFWTPLTWIGWKMEARRYMIRCKVWDASGAEPGTWDFEGFIPTRAGLPLVTVAYPYGDNANVAHQADNKVDGLWIRSQNTAYGGPQVSDHRNILVTYDPGGDTPTSMFASLDSPEGNNIGEIEVPYGAAYFVYWGVGDFTDADTELEISTKVWNPTDAPELQRAEETMYFFVIVGDFTIVSMNWREGERRGLPNRVLIGG